MISIEKIKLSEGLCKVLEDNEFYGYDNEFNKEDSGYYVEIGVYSPEDEDVLVSFYYDGTEEDFVKQFNEYAENFDVDEHVEMYVQIRGQNGVPESISALVEDAKWIKNTLTEVGNKLKVLENEIDYEVEVER